MSSAKVPTATQFFLGFSWHSDGYKKSQNRRRRRQQQKCKRGTVTLTRAGDDRKLSCPPSLRGNGNLFCLATKRATMAGRQEGHGTGIGMCVSALTRRIANCFLPSPIHSHSACRKERGILQFQTKGEFYVELTTSLYALNYACQKMSLYFVVRKLDSTGLG